MTEQKEIWLPINGFIGIYEISNLGRVKSLRRRVERKSKNGSSSFQIFPEKILKPFPQIGEYLCVHLRKNKQRYACRVHRLVVETFIGKIPTDKEVCHNDGNRVNNKLENLRIDSRTKNHKDKIKHGTDNRGEKHPLAKLAKKDILHIRNSKKKTVDLAKLYNMNVCYISTIKNGGRWKHIQYLSENSDKTRLLKKT